jgi:DNA modification methylase
MVMREEVIGDCRLILGDCRNAIASFPACFQPQAIVTDPPYPDFLADEFGFDQSAIVSVLAYPCQQFVFWSAKADFPLDWSAIHIWDKTGAGNIASYERIFERNGGKAYRVFRGNCISNPTMARFAKDQWVDHPTQKPASLMGEIVSEVSGAVFDPFMGSGTTGVACVNLGRAFLGVERTPKYFDIACRRIEEAYKQPRLFAEPVQKPVQDVLI